MILSKTKGVLLTFFITLPLYGKLIHVTDENQYNTVLNGNKQTVVEFSADWCSVCNGIKKPFEEIANDPEFQHVAFAQVDVDKLDSVSKQHGIVGVPTFVYVENGNKKVEEIGVQNMPSFKNHLRDNLRKTFKVAQNEPTMSISNDQPLELISTESLTVDSEAPIAPPITEPNIFIRILNGIKDFIMLIITKIKEFFTTIIDAIKGFFGV